jgi:hypothetical protein
MEEGIKKVPSPQNEKPTRCIISVQSKKMLTVSRKSGP